MGRKPVKKNRVFNQEVQQNWLKKLIPILSKSGFSVFTMDEMAKHIGVSKATFYKYFESKEEMIDAMIQFQLNQIIAYKDLLEDKSKPINERYISAIEVSAMAMSDISTIFLSDLKAEFPNKWKIIEEFKKQAIEVLKNFYQEGADEGYFNPDVNPIVMVLSDQIIFASINDPEILKDNNITLKNFFIDYFIMKSEGILKAKDLEKFRKRIVSLSEGIRS